jgi:hypothetical protein
LAQRFGVSQGTIRRIAHYSMYKWVKDDDEWSATLQAEDRRC